MTENVNPRTGGRSGAGARTNIAGSGAATAMVPRGTDDVLDAADDWWRSCADAALTALARSGRAFTCEDLADMGVPEADHPARMGALFRAAHAQDLIEPVGARMSSRPSRQGALIRIWRGRTEGEAAA